MMTEIEIKNLITKLRQAGERNGAAEKIAPVRFYLTGAIEALELTIGKTRSESVAEKIWKGLFDTDRN